jgi:hypothetical protein
MEFYTQTKILLSYEMYYYSYKKEIRKNRITEKYNLESRILNKIRIFKKCTSWIIFILEKNLEIEKGLVRRKKLKGITASTRPKKEVHKE